MAKLSDLPVDDLKDMLEAGEDVLECHRILQNTGDNIVGEVLRDQGKFYEWNHYPKGDVYDHETHSQYFYHAHPTGQRGNEHGHFHLFLRAKGMPKGISPASYTGDVEWPSGDDALGHLIAISMDKKGYPIALFTTNRWVTGETWYVDTHIQSMVDLFLIDHARPSWPVNIWMGAMVRLFKPAVKELVAERDEAVKLWLAKHPDRDVYEDRKLDVTSFRKISVEKQLAGVRKALE